MWITLNCTIIEPREVRSCSAPNLFYSLCLIVALAVLVLGQLVKIQPICITDSHTLRLCIVSVIGSLGQGDM